MIVLDAGILLAHLAVVDRHSDLAFEILDTDDELSIHPMTLAEVLVRPFRDGRESIASQGIDRLGVERLSPPRDEPIELARLRAQTGLRLPDCCVLAAAERVGATLATFDPRLAQTARDGGVAVVGA